MSARDDEIRELVAELRALMDRARPIVEKLTAAQPFAEELTALATPEEPDAP